MTEQQPPIPDSHRRWERWGPLVSIGRYFPLATWFQHFGGRGKFPYSLFQLCSLPLPWVCPCPASCRMTLDPAGGAPLPDLELVAPSRAEPHPHRLRQLSFLSLRGFSFSGKSRDVDYNLCALGLGPGAAVKASALVSFIFSQPRRASPPTASGAKAARAAPPESEPSPSRLLRSVLCRPYGQQTGGL